MISTSCKLFGKWVFVLMSVVLFNQVTAFAQEPKFEPLEHPDAKSSDRLSSPNRIVGTWNVRVRITVCATGATITSFDAMGMFGAKGTFHDTNATNPALRSQAFGYWERESGDQFYFAFRLFRFDPAGNNIGSQIVRHNVVLSPTGNTYTSSGTSEFYDAAGNLTMTGCSASTATRFY
ncbi:MAG: hypothetical protein HOP17_07700 [Acidobacteria bacterium]|nr:hypothetical protein [Acidobacteriota bacterium]